MTASSGEDPRFQVGRAFLPDRDRQDRQECLSYFSAGYVSWARFLRAGLCFAAIALAAAAGAGEYTGTEQSTRLYTKPDPSAGGGLKGKVQYPEAGLRMAFAVNSYDYKQVFKGTANGSEFSFTGLPVGKYDLVLVYANGFYEGLTLAKDASTLQDADRKAIETAIGHSVQFFDAKKIHRAEGTGGKGGAAKCVLEEMRTKPLTLQNAQVVNNVRPRSLKLAMVEEVGKGWQLVQTREILREEAGPQDRQGFYDHEYRPELQGIRVAGEVKDVGALNFRSKPLPK
jgi:hypothetical protein